MFRSHSPWASRPHPSLDCSACFDMIKIRDIEGAPIVYRRRPVRFRNVCLCGVVVFATSVMGLAQTNKAKTAAHSAKPAHVIIAPDAVKRVAPPPGMINGTPSVDAGSPLRYAVLEGDPTKAGQPFTIELGCSDGYKVAPHWHPTDENLIVLQGTFSVGTGDTYDPAALRDMGTGSYAFMPRRVHHFGSCKGETRVLAYGIGPFQLNFLGPSGGAQKKPAAK